MCDIQMVGTVVEQSCVACGTRLSDIPVVQIEKARLIRCDMCGSWTYFPRPNVQEQAAVHDSAEYFAHPYFQARREKGMRGRSCCEVFNRIGTVIDLRSLQGHRLLDVGCDTGSFLTDAAQCHGVVPIGLDVSSRAVQIARARGLQVHHGTIEDAPLGFTGFMVVTAIDVIEHVLNPEVFLRSIYERMDAGGVLYLQTPNVHSSLYQLGYRICQLTGARPRIVFSRLFPPQHLQCFSRYGLSSLAELCGFQVVKVETRSLPVSDIVAHQLVRSLVMGIQLLDFGKDQTLICALLQKPL